MKEIYINTINSIIDFLGDYKSYLTIAISMVLLSMINGLFYISPYDAVILSFIFDIATLFYLIQIALTVDYLLIERELRHIRRNKGVLKLNDAFNTTSKIVGLTGDYNGYDYSAKHPRSGSINRLVFEDPLYSVIEQEYIDNMINDNKNEYIKKEMKILFKTASHYKNYDEYPIRGAKHYECAYDYDFFSSVPYELYRREFPELRLPKKEKIFTTTVKVFLDAADIRMNNLKNGILEKNEHIYYSTVLDLDKKFYQRVNKEYIIRVRKKKIDCIKKKFK